MATFLRDPIWQFAGAIIALVSIGISVYLFMLERRRKSLSFRVMGRTNLVSLTDEVKGKIQILFEGKPVQSVHLIVLTVFNDGNVPITVSDFDRSLTFSFDQGTTLLSAEVTRTSPSSLHPTLSIEGNKVALNPTLLNSKDTVQITLLLSQYNGNIHHDARIVGIREVKQVARIARPLRRLGPPAPSYLDDDTW